MDRADLPTCVDTHVHLDDPAFDQDREAVLAASRAAGVTQFINIGYVPASWEASAHLRARHPEVAIVIGLHPGHADMWDDGLEVELEQAVQRLTPLGIGETGLDFVRPSPEPPQQVQAFRAQLDLARKRDLPVVIHQRQAAGELMSELDRSPGVQNVVLHSFDGDDRFIDWAVERDCYFGIGGLAAKRNSEALRTVLGRAPLERLLLETDSPYLAPPGTKSRRNAPVNLPLISQILAPIWGLSDRELMYQTQANARALFGNWGEGT